MADSELKQRAGEYFRRAYEHQQNGEYEEAIELYSHSIDAFPTAEAYTFRGWAYSFQGNYAQPLPIAAAPSKSIPNSAILITTSARI